MKKLLKILVWTASIVVALLLVVIVCVKIFFPAEKVKAMAVEQGSAVLGREVSVEGLDISIWGGLGVELQDVRISNPPGVDGPHFLAANNVDLKLQLWPLIRGDIRVDRLIIDSPDIYMLKTAAGAVNYSFDLPDSTLPPEVAKATEDLPEEAKPAAAAISFDALEIVNGRLLFQDDSTGLRVELVNLGLSTSLENPRSGFFASSGHLEIDSIKATIEDAYPVIALDLDYETGYDMNKGTVAIEKGDFTVNGIKFKLSGNLGDPLGVLWAKTNIQSDGVTVQDLLALLPPKQLEVMKDFSIEGKFAFDADLEYTPDSETPVFYTGTASLTDLTMSKSDVQGELKFGRCLIDFKPDDLRANIEDGSFDGQPFKGYVTVTDFEKPTVGGELAGGFDLVFLKPFLPAEPAHDVSGQTQFDLKFSGQASEPEKMLFSGNLTVEKGKYSSALIPEPVNEFSVDAYFDNRLLHVRKLNCSFPSGGLGFTGRVTDLMALMLADSADAAKIHPEIEGSLKGQVDLAMLDQYLPEKGNPSVTGKLAVDLTLSGRGGDLTSLKPLGSMVISDAAYTDSLLPEPVRHFEARLDLIADTIIVSNLKVKFVSSDASFNGRLANPFPYLLPVEGLDRSTVKRPFFTFELAANRFDTDKMFPAAVPGSASDPTTVSMDSISIVILPDIDGKGTVKADTVIYCGVELTGVDGKIRIRDRKIECYDATARVYTGGVAGKTTIDLSDFENPHYTGEFTGTQIEADDFLSRFTKFGGHLFGKANVSGSYDARGWDPDAFLNSLTLDGVGNLREGKLVTNGTAYGVLKELAEKTGESIDKEQIIKTLTTKIHVQDGKVKLDQMQTTLGSIGDLSFDGSYGFDGSLAYKGILNLSTAYTAKLKHSFGDIVSSLADPDTGRLPLPLVISGTTESPSVGIDWTSLSLKATDDIKKKAGDLIKGLFKK